MKKQYKELSDYHTDPKDPELPFFQRFIPAFLVMERWGMDYRVFRNHPLCRHRSLVATREYDDTVNNPYLLNHTGRKNPFKGLIWPPKDIPPFEKEDFERVVYDFYTIVEYEYRHPEIVKNPDVCIQLEEALHPTKKEERDRLLSIESSREDKPESAKNPIQKPETCDIEALISSVCPELEKFYNGLAEEIENVYNERESIKTLEQSALYDMALAFFDQTKSEYTFLKKTMIDHEEYFRYVERRKRRIIGIILQNYLKNSNISAVINKLHILHNKIILKKID